MLFCSSVQDTNGNIWYPKVILYFQEIACVCLATTCALITRQRLWVSWWCTRFPIQCQSLVAVGSSGRLVMSQCTGWSIRLSTSWWQSRWWDAALAMCKLVVTVPCVSILHWSGLKKSTHCFVLRLQKTLFLSAKSDYVPHTHTQTHTVSGQAVSVTFQCVVLCARHQMEALKLQCYKYLTANIWPATCYFLWMKL